MRIFLGQKMKNSGVIIRQKRGVLKSGGGYDTFDAEKYGIVIEVIREYMQIITEWDDGEVRRLRFTEFNCGKFVFEKNPFLYYYKCDFLEKISDRIK